MEMEQLVVSERSFEFGLGVTEQVERIWICSGGADVVPVEEQSFDLVIVNSS